MHAQKLSHARQSYQERTLYQWLKLSTGLFIAAGVIFTLVSLTQLWIYVQLKTQQKELTEELALLSQTEERMHTVEPRLKQNEELNKELTPSSACAHCLTTLSQSLPEATYLSSVTYTPKSLQIEGFAPHKAELDGFMATLSNSSEYSRVILTTSQEQLFGLFFRISAEHTSAREGTPITSNDSAEVNDKQKR